MQPGVIAALVTPMRPDEVIDFGAWQDLIERLKRSHATGLSVLDDAGEWWALSEEEKLLSLRFCRQIAGRDLELYANVAATTTRESIRLAGAAEAEEFRGIFASVPPFLRVDEQAAVEHLAEIARAVRLPVYARTRLSQAAAARLAEMCPNLAGVAGSAAGLRPVVEGMRGLEEVRAAGAEVLLVSGWASLLPELYVQVRLALREQRHEDAASLAVPARQLEEASPESARCAVLKTALELAGFPCGMPRKPLQPLGAAGRREISAVLEGLQSRDLVLFASFTQA